MLTQAMHHDPAEVAAQASAGPGYKHLRSVAAPTTVSWFMFSSRSSPTWSLRQGGDNTYLEPVGDVRIDFIDDLHPVIDDGRRLARLQRGLYIKHPSVPILMRPASVRSGRGGGGRLGGDHPGPLMLLPGSGRAGDFFDIPAKLDTLARKYPLLIDIMGRECTPSKSSYPYTSITVLLRNGRVRMLLESRGLESVSK